MKREEDTDEMCMPVIIEGDHFDLFCKNPMRLNNNMRMSMFVKEKNLNILTGGLEKLFIRELSSREVHMDSDEETDPHNTVDWDKVNLQKHYYS